MKLFSLPFPFSLSFNKRVKNNTLIAHLRKAVETLNAEGYQHTNETSKKELRFEMSYASGPQRIEMLKSYMGGMKVELFHTRAQIEQMMGMIQQLLQDQQTEANRKISKVAPGAETQTMTAATPEGHRAKKGVLAQAMAPQQQLLQGGKCLTTAAERRMNQDLLTTPTGDQRFCLAWAR